MIPGSTDIVVDVAPVEWAHVPEMPDWQFGGAAGNASYRPALSHKAFQQCFHGNTLPPGFGCQAIFGFARDFDTHGTAPFSGYRNGPFLRWWGAEQPAQ